MRAKLYKISVLLLLFLGLNKLAISCEEKNKSLDFIRGKQIELSEELPEQEEILELVDPYKSKLEKEINTPLCYNPRFLAKNESELESSLGNLMADICFEAGDSILQAVKGRELDLAVFNYGGMRAPLNEGTITIEDVFQLMPFENRLVIMELGPDRMEKLIDYLEAQKQAHPISGMRMIMENGRIKSVEIGGRKLDPNKSYHVLTIDYLQNGGGNMTFFKDPDYLYVSDLKVRDALISSFSRTDTLRAALDGRFAQK